MKNSLKKIIALVLSLIIISSVMAVGFSVYAEDAVSVTVADSEEETEEDNHTSFFALTINFFREIFRFFKYIFYDVFLGKPVPDVPPLSHTHASTAVAAA